MSHKASDDSKLIVGTQEMSEIFGLTKRRIQQLAKDGAFVKSARGMFDLPSSIQTYIEYLKPNKEELNKSEEEALWTKARREKTELELQIMRGDVHSSEDVENVMNDMLTSFRQRILSIPTKLSPQLINISETNTIKAKLMNVLNEALSELSDYNPEIFIKEHMKTNEDEES